MNLIATVEMDTLCLSPIFFNILSRDWNIGNHWQTRLTLQDSFQTEIFFEDDNSSNAGQNTQSSYNLINIYLDLRYQENTSFNFYVKNVADKEYIIDAGNFGAISGMPTFVSAIGRTFGLSANYIF